MAQRRRLAAQVGLAVGLAALVAVYRHELVGWLPSDRDATSSADEPVAFFTCPMDPSVESDHAGPCPICGMSLTPVSKEDRSSGVVPVAAAVRTRLGMVVVPVETRPLVRRIVASGEVLAVRAPADRASVDVRVYRGDPRDVQPGQAVTVSVPALPVTQFTGAVVVAPPRASAAPATLRLVVDDPGHALQPGMRVEAQLDVELSPRLVVPAEAVVYAGSRRIVFVEHGSGRFEPRTPKLGVTAAGLVEVVDGLVAGDRVVVKGTFLLAAEHRLRSDGALWKEPAKIAPAKRTAPPDSPATSNPMGRP